MLDKASPSLHLNRQPILLQDLGTRKDIGGNMRRYGLFRCSCGKEFENLTQKIFTGQIKSCGCLGKSGNRNINRKHGLSDKSRAYSIWKVMRQRCNNPRAKKYPNYGGRGISVCPEWNDFQTFLDDMGEPPTSKHSIDRRDNNGNYCKDNCRWATSKEQSRNKSDNRFLTLDGERLCITDWGRRMNISEATIARRLDDGWCIKDAITLPAYSKPMLV